MCCVLSVAVSANSGIDEVPPFPPEEDMNPLTQDMGTLLTAFPDGATLPAPEWVKPGLRVYYSTGLKNLDKKKVTSNLDEYVPIIRLDKVKESGPIILRNDVTSLSSNSATTHSTAFVGDRMIPWEESTAKTYASAGPFWLSKEVIDAIENMSEVLKTEDIEFEIGGKAFDAVKIDYKESSSPKPTYYTWILDKDTGLMLYMAQIVENGLKGKLSISIAEFADMRYMHIPWAGSSTPEWVKQGNIITYNGTMNNWAPTSGANPPSLAVLPVQVEEVDNEWVKFSVNRAISSNESIYSGSFISGSSMLIGGFWIPPSYLDGMKAGDVLDTFDPITMSSVRISKVEVMSDSDTIVTVTEYGKNYNRDWSYRVSDGLLVAWNMYKIVDPIKGTVQQTEWKLSSFNSEN